MIDRALGMICVYAVHELTHALRLRAECLSGPLRNFKRVVTCSRIFCERYNITRVGPSMLCKL